MLPEEPQQPQSITPTETPKGKGIYTLIIVLLLAFLLVGLVSYYFYNKRSPAYTGVNKTQTLNITNQTNSASKTEVYTGTLQEVAAKDKTEKGVLYTHVVGLLDDSSNIIAIWLTEQEFKNMQYFDSKGAEKVSITLDQITGAHRVRVTKATNASSTPKNSYTLEILN